MATTPYPLPREKRESTILVGNGTVGPYGPSAFKVFDVTDVVVWVRTAGSDFFLDATAGTTVVKTLDAAFDTFSVTFAAPVLASTEFVLQARRVHDRQNAVTKGVGISASELEKELSKQGSVLEELRRDVERAVRVDPGEAPARVRPGAAGELMKTDADGNIAGSGENVETILGKTADAAASAELARQWAENPVGVDVTPGHKSAMHWALVAAAAVVGNIGAAINSLTGKATPVGADKLVIADSADSWISKSLTLTNLAAWLGSLTQTLTNKTISGLATPLSIADGGTGQTSSSAAFGAIKQAASDTATGVVELATAAEVATGTDAARVPSVATMKNHQGVCKVWVNFNGTGTVAIRDSFNVSSITDNGNGDYSVNFTAAMPNANYAIWISCGSTSGNMGTTTAIPASLSTTALARVQTGYINPSAVSVLQDNTVVNVGIFGD